MIKPDFLKKLADDLGDLVPSHVGTLKKDFEKNCQALLKQTFAKFDLVTREEFDTQTKVLARTRKKLDELEAKLNGMEDLLRKPHGRKDKDK